MKCSYLPCDFETDPALGPGRALAALNTHSATEHREERKARKEANAFAKLQASSGAEKPTAKRKPRGAAEEPSAGDPQPAPPADDLSAEGHASEVAPTVGKPTWRERMWGKKADRPVKPGRERKPRVVRKRVSTARLLGGAWGVTGMGLARFGVDEPVGRVMQFQGPAAGVILENLTKNTMVDVPLQYLAARADEVEAAVGLFELPLLVFLYERANDDMAQVLEPMLVAAIRRSFVAMVPVVKKARAEEAAWRAAVAELGLSGDDPVRDMLAEIFQPAGAEERSREEPAA